MEVRESWEGWPRLQDWCTTHIFGSKKEKTRDEQERAKKEESNEDTDDKAEQRKQQLVLKFRVADRALSRVKTFHLPTRGCGATVRLEIVVVAHPFGSVSAAQ